MDIAAEEIGTNVPTEVPLVGDAESRDDAARGSPGRRPWQVAVDSPWRQGLRQELVEEAATGPLLESDEVPMNYYRPLKVLQDALPRDAIIVTEGASTMDISRQVLDNYEPRHRLDAGSWGTMGVGLGFAIAAQLATRQARYCSGRGCRVWL